MDLVDTPLAKHWLTQFKEEDVGTAESLLRTLRLVSHNEIEDSLRKELELFASKEAGTIALIPVAKKIPTTMEKLSSERHKGKLTPQKRRQYGSEDQMGLMLRALEQTFPRRFSVEPTLRSMRLQKVKHIVLVDDLSGTGTRIISFWRKYASPSIRSWLSSKHCKLWILVFAADRITCQNIYTSLKQLKPNSIRTIMETDKKNLIREKALIELGEKYGPTRKNGGRTLFGFQSSLSNVVFQHSCPNNAPPLLWKSKNGWRPLFPKRVVPRELFPCFEQQTDSGLQTGRLRRSRQFRLALAIEEGCRDRTLSQSTKTLLVILGLLIKGLRVNKLSAQLMLTQTTIDDFMKKAHHFGLLDSLNKVTPFGKDLIRRTKKGRQRSGPKKIKGVADAIQFYYP